MILPPPGSIAKYVFTTKFASLNGVYTLIASYSFETAVASGIDFVKNFYKPAGLSDDDFGHDYLNYRGKPVLELVAIGNGTTSSSPIYAPQAALGAIPDLTVSRYQNLMITVKLPPMQDPSQVTYINDFLIQTVASVTGDTSSVSWKIADSKYDQYLTNAEYQDLLTAREAKIKQLDLYPQTIANLTQQIAELQNKLRVYEQNLIDSVTVVQAAEKSSPGTR